MALPALALAATPAAGLLGTAHDFSSAASSVLGTQYMVRSTLSTSYQTSTANTVGLCTYCHTPHSALQTALLWNHKPSTNPKFTWDDATTTGGTAFASLTPSYKGASVKCLSCHDGSVAIGDISIYKQRTNGTAATNWNTFKIGAGVTQIGGGGNMSGNHPVGMPYPLGQANSTYNAILLGSNVDKTEFVGDPTASATAMIKLYSDAGGTIVGNPAAGTTGMECSTCHDPHNKSTVDDIFLRGKINGSTVAQGYICVQCHIK